MKFYSCYEISHLLVLSLNVCRKIMVRFKSVFFQVLKFKFVQNTFRLSEVICTIEVLTSLTMAIEWRSVRKLGYYPPWCVHWPYTQLYNCTTIIIHHRVSIWSTLQFDTNNTTTYNNRIIHHVVSPSNNNIAPHARPQWSNTI